MKKIKVIIKLPPPFLVVFQNVFNLQKT